MIRVQFVVDTTGHALLASFRVLGGDGRQTGAANAIVDDHRPGSGVEPLSPSDQQLFAGSIRIAIGRTRFRPAEARGVKVPQLVEQVFVFQLAR